VYGEGSKIHIKRRKPIKGEFYMLVSRTRYECNNCGSVVSDNVINDCKIDIAENIICRFCHENPKIHDIAFANTFIAVFDHFNNTRYGHVVDAIFYEDNGISDFRIVVRLNYDHAKGNGYDGVQPPEGFIYATRKKDRRKSKPVDVVYRIDRAVANDEPALHEAIECAINALHKWIPRLLR
jgi:hypothetical protein